MATFTKNTIFTNVALTSDGDVWWEGKTQDPPVNLKDWTGQDWTPESGRTAAHPNSRYTVPSSQCPVMDPDWENPNGVPISAIIFGGKRKGVFPLVSEASNWEQGIFLASCVAKESVEGTLPLHYLVIDPGVARTPFAVSPFLGYNINQYMKKWVELRQYSGYNIPKIFMVNWFR